MRSATAVAPLGAALVCAGCGDSRADGNRSDQCGARAGAEHPLNQHYRWKLIPD